MEKEPCSNEEEKRKEKTKLHYELTVGMILYCKATRVLNYVYVQNI